MTEGTGFKAATWTRRVKVAGRIGGTSYVLVWVVCGGVGTLTESQSWIKPTFAPFLPRNAPSKRGSGDRGWSSGKTINLNRGWWWLNFSWINWIEGLLTRLKRSHYKKPVEFCWDAFNWKAALAWLNQPEPLRCFGTHHRVVVRLRCGECRARQIIWWCSTRDLFLVVVNFMGLTARTSPLYKFRWVSMALHCARKRSAMQCDLRLSRCEAPLEPFHCLIEAWHEAAWVFGEWIAGWELSYFRNANNAFKGCGAWVEENVSLRFGPFFLSFFFFFSVLSWTVIPFKLVCQ